MIQTIEALVNAVQLRKTNPEASRELLHYELEAIYHLGRATVVIITLLAFLTLLALWSPPVFWYVLLLVWFAAYNIFRFVQRITDAALVLKVTAAARRLELGCALNKDVHRVRKVFSK